MAQFMGVDLESPQEAQQRILAERLASMKTLGPDPYANIGFNIADGLTRAFGGGGAKQISEAEATQEYIGTLQTAGEEARAKAKAEGRDEELASIEGIARALSMSKNLPDSPQTRQVQAQLRARMNELAQEYKVRQAELGKFRAQEDSARATAELNIKRAEDLGKTDLERLQDQRDALESRKEGLTSEKSIKAIDRKIAQVDQAIAKETAIVGENLLGGGPIPLGTAPENTVQKDAVSLQNRRARLDEIQNSFTPELLTVQGKAATAAAWAADKVGVQWGEERLEQWTDLSQSAARELTQTLKEMSGAAVTPQEAERQLTVIPNPGTLKNPFSGDSPDQFKRKLDNQVAWVDAAQMRYDDLLRRGLLKPGDSVTEELATEYPVDKYMETQSPSAESPSGPVKTQSGATIEFIDEE